MNILLVLFLFNPDAAILPSYLKTYCNDKGGDGFMYISEDSVIMNCKNKGSFQFYSSKVKTK